jgi:SNF family Na+-dependent transporter
LFVFTFPSSKVGLGNFWRFPAQIYANGGATWFIPYFVCLFAIGVPMMLIEVTLGQVFQRGAVGSLGAINPCLRGVGYMAGGVSYLVTCYYAMILAYTLIYLTESFYTDLPWSPARDASLSPVCAAATQNNHALYHFRKTIGFYTDDSCEAVDLNTLGAPIGTIVAGSFVTWVLVYLSIFNGANATSKVVYLTVILPVLVIVALMIRTLTLEGSSEGVYEYLAHWRFDELFDGNKWSAAVTQIFFTLSVGSGVMIAYGSFNEAKKPVLADSCIISFGNFAVSFLSGFVVFATVGYQAGQQGLTFEEVVFSRIPFFLFSFFSFFPFFPFSPPPPPFYCLFFQFQSVADIGGPGLVFVTLPRALATLSQGSAQLFCVLLFLMLFMLGLDSAFSLVESPAAIIDDLVHV